MKYPGSIKFIFVLVFLLSRFTCSADEGMWPLIFLNKLDQEELKRAGLKLTPEQIYSINKSSLKDAIVSISGGMCTAEVISKDGLLLSNHHCGYDAIQSHSSVEKNYLQDGFWAKKRTEEKPIEGMSVSFLVRMEDVTSKVLSRLNATLTPQERADKVGKVSDSLIVTAIKGTHYNAEVKSLFEGNEYYLFIYETYRDVRLVGAPPSSIGKFGGETDNWMWPRHTGDFCLLRIYTAPNGEPAEYEADNVPLRAKYHLPVSLKGVEKNDFTIVMGYPGTTDRYLTSYGVKQTLELLNPARIKLRDSRLSIYKQGMDQSKDVKIKYSSKYATIANYWKFFIGESEGLRKLKIYEQKKDEEKAFLNWVNAEEQRRKKYGALLENIGSAYQDLEKVMKFNVYLNEAAFAPEIVSLAYQFASLYQALGETSADKEKVKMAIEASREISDKHFKDYDEATDKKLLQAMLEFFIKDIPVEQQPEFIRQMVTRYNNNIKVYVEDIFLKSLLASKIRVEGFLNNPDFRALDEDPAFNLMRSVLVTYFNKISPELNAANERLESNTRLYLKALREMKPTKVFYPNANSTLRINFGKVQDYYPKDGVHYTHFTTLDGIIEKEDTTSEEFKVPGKLKELHNKKDYGPYGSQGKMKVCFITNNDITGGNSGSPVLNGKGELIGLAFDGNWEAMSGNISYEPQLQRCIAVDIRYVLFVIDKFGGAGNLIKELTLAK